MPRARTDGPERNAQNRKLVAAVEAEVGRPVSIREAARHRAQKKRQPAPGSAYTIRDRVIEHDPADARRRGHLLGRVQGFKTFAGGYSTFMLVASFEFAHTLAEVSQLADDRVLLLSFDELAPSFDGDRKITRREREAHRRRHDIPPAQSADTEFVVADRRLADVDLDAATESRPVGQLLARPLSLHSTAARDTIVEFRTSPTVTHTLVDASMLSLGHPLLVTVDELPDSTDNGATA